MTPLEENWTMRDVAQSELIKRSWRDPELRALDIEEGCFDRDARNHRPKQLFESNIYERR